MRSGRGRISGASERDPVAYSVGVEVLEEGHEDAELDVLHDDLARHHSTHRWVADHRQPKGNQSQPSVGGGGRCYLLLRRLAHARAEHDPKVLAARGEDHAVRGDLRRSRRDRAKIVPRLHQDRAKIAPRSR